MSEIPQEAVQAGARVLRSRDHDKTFEGYARAVLEAAAPVIAEHLAVTFEAMVGNYPEDVFTPDGTTPDAIAGQAMRRAYRNAARMVREAFPKGDDGG